MERPDAVSAKGFNGLEAPTCGALFAKCDSRWQVVCGVQQRSPLRRSSENAFINIKNRSFSIEAEVEIPQGGGNGVILAQAGRFGGWSLYLKSRKPTYCYNFLGLQQYKVSAPQALPAGIATVRMNFEYDGGGVGKGGTATLLVNGNKVASGRIERTQGAATPVTSDYKERDNAFTGKIRKVTVDVKPIGVATKIAAE